jgi:hypothetical protein
MTDLRRIDALVAEHVMGHDFVYIDLNVTPRIAVDDGTDEGHEEMPYYSSDIAAAWEVVERLKMYEPEISWNDEHQGWSVSLWKFSAIRSQCGVSAETAPLTICLAALKAKGVDV